MLEIYNGLEVSTRKINANFKIKVNGEFEGRKLNTLVGVYGLIKLVGIDMSNKLIKRAFKSRADKQECKLRRGIRVTFYSN